MELVFMDGYVWSIMKYDHIVDILSILILHYNIIMIIPWSTGPSTYLRTTFNCSTRREVLKIQNKYFEVLWEKSNLVAQIIKTWNSIILTILDWMPEGKNETIGEMEEEKRNMHQWRTVDEVTQGRDLWRCNVSDEKLKKQISK